MVLKLLQLIKAGCSCYMPTAVGGYNTQSKATGEWQRQCCWPKIDNSTDTLIKMWICNCCVALYYWTDIGKSFTPVTGSLFGPLSRRIFHQRDFNNEISSSALLDIQLTLLCTRLWSGFIDPRIRTFSKFFPTRLLGLLEKRSKIWRCSRSWCQVWSLSFENVVQNWSCYRRYGPEVSLSEPVFVALFF